MRVLFKQSLVIMIAETDTEKDALAAWRPAHSGHVFHARPDAAEGGASLVFDDLGERSEACREPINVVSASADPSVRMISNFAEASFALDGVRYRSVESFWQGLKFPSLEERTRIAALDGKQAQAAGRRQGYPKTIDYLGAQIPPGGPEHWRLMEAACRAKFAQNAEARAALLATGDRPLVHRVRRDSRAIPGIVMADIWMRTRRWLRRGQQA